MPPFNNTGDETETKKRSASEIAAGITNVLLILIIAFFTCASLWLGVFAIPSFFAFFRASVVAISSVREVSGTIVQQRWVFLRTHFLENCSAARTAVYFVWSYI